MDFLFVSLFLKNHTPDDLPSKIPGVPKEKFPENMIQKVPFFRSPVSKNIKKKSPPTWRIIPVSKWLVTPIYKPFRLFGRGPTILLRERKRSPWLWKPSSKVLGPLAVRQSRRSREHPCPAYLVKAPQICQSDERSLLWLVNVPPPPDHVPPPRNKAGY